MKVVATLQAENTVKNPVASREYLLKKARQVGVETCSAIIFHKDLPKGQGSMSICMEPRTRMHAVTMKKQ